MKNRLTKNQKVFYEKLDEINDTIKYLNSLGYDLDDYSIDKPKHITQKFLQTLNEIDFDTILSSFGVEENVRIIDVIKEAILKLPDVKYYNGGEQWLSQKTMLISLIDDRINLSDSESVRDYIRYLESVSGEILENLEMIKFESKQEALDTNMNKVIKLLIGKITQSRAREIDEQLNELYEYYANYFDDRYDDY